MRFITLFCAAWGLPLLSLLSPTQLRAGRRPQLVVGSDKTTCPDATFVHIQDAVNAASPGSEIRVCKGTYVEQVVVNKPVDIDSDSGAVLMSNSMQANTSSLVDSSPIAAALLVSGTTDVSISGLIVDGTNNGILGCAPRVFGIYFQNASGEIDRDTVRGFKLSTSLNGCQSGTDIFVQSGGGGASHVRIEHCSIHDYQKNGITANEAGTSVIVDGNVVTGLGPTTGAAENGIQIGFGATGSISSNTVTNNIWSPCVTVSNCTAIATNILVEQSDGVVVTQNQVGISQVPIFISGNQSYVNDNEAFGADVFDGIHLEGEQNRVMHNQVFTGPESGIFVSGNNNVIERNTITDALIGVLKAAGSVGNLIRFNNVYDTPTAVQDPASSLSAAVQPER